MIRSMYSGVSGMRGFQTKLDVIGNNIANVNTVGFKAGRVMFKDILSQSMSGVTAPVEGTTGGVNAKQVGLGVAVSSIDTVHSAGSAMTTSNATDLRIDGDGFFMVKTSAEQAVPYLTRAGNFTPDAAGQLVNPDGMLLLSLDGEPITLPREITAFNISQDGRIIQIDADGLATDSGFQIGLAKVYNPNGLEKVGGNMYRLTPNANLESELITGAPSDPELGLGAIISGQLEMSNVDLTNEFTEMIVAQRGFQANSKIITTSDEVLQEIVNLKR
ncbi:flagellar basal body rod protein FlgG [Cohnella abietis]|uniref:Flagellar hook protein FlgE n=1 Tax=Cohnella abietis TaxID=2507935 RepID=A0A3T1D8M7_9BACL|nr:flagellar basal body rod protein FlgG [Cohnella abietis]BBI34433.1 flagellar basal-body rod protein FlgG [Cohnella abietis]